jgi:hypothetical protein
MRKETKAEKYQRWLRAAGVAHDVKTKTDESFIGDYLTTEVIVRGPRYWVQAIFTRKVPRKDKRLMPCRTSETVWGQLCNGNGRERLRGLSALAYWAKVAAGVKAD